MNLNPIGFAGMAVVLCVVPALAHHSFAMFDAEKTVSIEGTVKEFQWTNPHSWIHLTVADSEGKPVLWSVELGAPTGLARQGWVPKTLTPGMNVKLLIHPLIVFALMLLFGPFPAPWASTAVLMASLPPALNVFVIARQNDAWIEPASVAVMIGTFASVVTLTGAMWLIQTGRLAFP